MAKIWTGGRSSEGSVDLNDILVNEDAKVDENFASYEILMLISYHLEIAEEGLISKDESVSILKTLVSMLNSEFKIDPELEDVHGNVEDKVLKAIGEAGNNLRLFLSRNEQIHTDILLYAKTKLLYLALLSAKVSEAVIEKRHFFNGSIPGYTHYRQGMVVSIKTYFDYVASIFMDASKDFVKTSDDITYLPLGYGSGFGSLSGVDFSKIYKDLGFSTNSRNPLHLSSKRGLDEIAVIYPVLKLMINLSRISQDLIILSSDEIPIFVLPNGFTTGSSLMANKRNPDFLEIVQGYASELAGSFQTLLLIVTNKSSGYHRDFQISKRIMVEAIEKTTAILKAFLKFFDMISFDEKAAARVIKNSTYATANARKIFESGNTWKKSYNEVGKLVREGKQLEEIEPESIISLSNDELKLQIELIENKISIKTSVQDKIVKSAIEFVSGK